MPIPRLLTSWRAEPGIGGNIEAWRSLPARPAQYASLPAGLHSALRDALQAGDIRALYTHQAAAWDQVQAGNHVVVVTGTASGKTLCYNLPVLDHLLRDPQARALYLFPTKALAQDQLSALGKQLSILSGQVPLPVAAYDGDTPQSSRPSIRTNARIVISNPDMLHAGILPHHTRWAEFFKNLRFVVLDEMHVYRGVFGSHVANVLRRFKRIAGFYGSRPQFILTSATIANPVELASSLIEEDVSLIDQDGSGHGAKSFLIYNPPIVNPDLGLRRSALQESVRLADELLAEEVQTIIFGRSRRSVELILTYLRQQPSAAIPEGQSSGASGLDSSPGVRGYRSGYLPRQRREIERGLRQGDVRAVVATNALELGIDIGAMGAAILVGYPGTIASTVQQAGRAGRGDGSSLAILVATADPLDQFLAHHPEYIFDRSPEQALINPDNLLILLSHLRCAAFELPFQYGESFGTINPEQVQEFLDYLSAEGDLHQSGSRYFWMADRYPAQDISLRSASADNVVLQVMDGLSPLDGSPAITIGEVDQASARWMVHPQAVYLHEGQMYAVEDLDLEQNVAYLRPAVLDYYTEPQSETAVQLVELIDQGNAVGALKSYGEIRVTTQITGFRKVRWFTHEQLGQGEVNLPPTELQTTGYWLALSEATVSRLREEGLWRNDPNDYGPNWSWQRDLARARDGFRCQVCGTPEQGRSHDVHHKIPFRAFQNARYGLPVGHGQPVHEIANRLENLITLCPACHRRAETAVRVRSGLAGLGFVLGHLAPLFLMCDRRDLGVHSDPQSPLAEGQPCVVFYDQVPAGIGLSQRLYELHQGLVGRALDLVAACECADGCPSCVGPGGENGIGGKQETIAILEALNSG